MLAPVSVASLSTMNAQGLGLVALSQGVGFCLATSVAFVGSLYVLVPAQVRKLDRNHPRQIKWRTWATGMVCLGAWAGKQYILRGGHDTYEDFGNQQHDKESMYRKILLPWLSGTVVASAKVLAHVMALYMGPIVQGAAHTAVYLRRQHNDTPFHLGEYIKSVYADHIEPTIRSMTFADSNKEAGWITWRNLILAPCLEEVAFRTCMVPVLWACGLSLMTVCWTAPLFFGVAHMHHTMQRLCEGTQPIVVAIQTAFQLTYTTLFGAYAAYAYMQTQSTTAIVLAHAFCNWMGLPNFLFFQKQHVLYDCRGWLLIAHLVGMASFGAALLRGFLRS